MNFCFKAGLKLKLLLLGAVIACSSLVATAAEPIRFEVPVLPELQRYSDFLTYPGYLAVALENIGLSPSLSSKLSIREEGHGAELRNAVLRYTGRKGHLYSYEAGLALDFGVTVPNLTFPVTLDVSGLSGGKLLVTVSPPLAGIVPQDVIERIRIKTQLVANLAAQKRVLNYLDSLTKSAPGGTGVTGLFEPILVEAYNKSSPSRSVTNRDAGDAIPLSDQWMLILTLAIWFIMPAVLLVQRFRRRRANSA